MNNKLISLIIVLFTFAAAGIAQPKSNEAIIKQIKELKAEKAIRVEYDANSNVTKLMAVSDNFSDSDAKKVGAMAMNFAIGILYPGQTLEKVPDQLLVSVWVMTKKPRFGENNSLKIGEFDLGNARYVPKMRINMEYLNYELSFERLKSIAASSDSKLKLGDYDISFTVEQKAQLKQMVKILSN